MPNFKPKTKKKIRMNKKSIITVDNKHNEKMKELNTIRKKKIPQLKKRRKSLKERISEETILERKLDLQDKLNEVKAEISKLKTLRKKYLLDNSKYIFDYFEKKKRFQKVTIKQKFYILFLIIRVQINVQIKALYKNISQMLMKSC